MNSPEVPADEAGENLRPGVQGVAEGHEEGARRSTGKAGLAPEPALRSPEKIGEG